MIRLIIGGLCFALAIRWAIAALRGRRGPLEGVDPVSRVRTGLRVSPLSPGERRAALEREILLGY